MFQLFKLETIFSLKWDFQSWNQVTFFFFFYGMETEEAAVCQLYWKTKTKKVIGWLISCWVSVQKQKSVQAMDEMMKQMS